MTPSCRAGGTMTPMAPEPADAGWEEREGRRQTLPAAPGGARQAQAPSHSVLARSLGV